jgi:SAM-dependent methyltransferase
MTVERDYLLGTHDEEIERLGLQHRVWREHALKGWARAGITTGDVVIDVGCGPGYAALDLADLVGPTGKVVALDQSERFLSALRHAAEAHGLHHVVPYSVDLGSDDWPDVVADAAWCRWVAAFLPDPGVMVNRLARALRPGGVLVAHEYADYRSWKLLPPSAEFDAFVDGVITSWRGSGGEPDAGLSLPAQLEAAGFEILSLTPIVSVASPADLIWQWPRAFMDVGLRRLVSLGQIDATGASSMWEDFLMREADGHTRMLTPLVLETVARRR